MYAARMQRPIHGEGAPEHALERLAGQERAQQGEHPGHVFIQRAARVVDGVHGVFLPLVWEKSSAAGASGGRRRRHRSYLTSVMRVGWGATPTSGCMEMAALGFAP